MKNILIYSILTFSFIFFSACSDEDKSAVTPVHWDRDMCERCVMVVSDRRNTVQVKDPRGKAYMFDDIGCTILWFKEENISWKDEAMIWITDVDTGEWIDARKAFYDTENITPMAFGFSAHKVKEMIKKDQEIIDFKEVSRRILKTSK